MNSSSSDHFSLQNWKQCMIEKGFCPRQVDAWTQLLDSHVLQQMEFLCCDELESGIEDYPCHDGCRTSDRCVAYKINPMTISDYHARDCNRAMCYMVEIPAKKIAEAISNGQLPLLSVKTYDRNPPNKKIKVHRREAFDTYHIISHGRQTGPTITRSGEVPVCQLDRIDEALREFQEAPPASTGPRQFWLDDLCIPSQNNELRSKVLGHLASIYSDADRVLVLDAELINGVLWDWASGNLLLHPPLGAWTSSPWSLMLHASFTLSYDLDVRRQFWWDSPEGIEYDIRSHLSRFFYGKVSSWPNTDRRKIFKMPSALDEGLVGPASELSRNQLSEYQRFVNSWNGLAGRFSPTSESLTLILSYCLHLNLEKLEAMDGSEERVTQSILAQEKLPFSIFFNTGRKYRPSEDHLNRWLPIEMSTSLMTKGTTVRFAKMRCSTTDRSQEPATSHLEVVRSRIKSNPDVSFYFIPTTIKVLRKFYLQIDVDGDRYLIESLHNPGDQFGNSKYAYMCIAIENEHLGAMDYLRGACFYISTLKDGSKISSGHAKLELVFHSPVKCRKIAKDSDTEPDSGCQTLEAKTVHQKCGLKVLYEPLPKVKGLKRKPPPDVPYWLVIAMITAYIVLFMAAYNVAVYFIGRSISYHNSTSWGPVVTVLIAIVLAFFTYYLSHFLFYVPLVILMILKMVSLHEYYYSNSITRKLGRWVRRRLGFTFFSRQRFDEKEETLGTVMV